MPGCVARAPPQGEPATPASTLRCPRRVNKGAYAVSAEDRIGSIEEGKLADTIVLDRNLLEIEPTDIRNTRVLKTILNGVLVYES